MKFIFVIFPIFFSITTWSADLELVSKYNLTKFTDGKVINVKSALAKASDFTEWQATSIGMGTGASLAYIAGGNSNLIKGASLAGGIIALIHNLEKIDVHVITVELNNGSKAIVNQLKVFPFEIDDKITLTELNGQAYVDLNRGTYSELELGQIDKRELFFQKESVMASTYRKNCIDLKEKELKKKWKKRYSKGKADCDLKPVVLTNSELKLYKLK